MLKIRRMRSTDIRFAVHLTSFEGWGIPPQDFERILRLDAKGSFIATVGAQRVGIATTTSYRRQIAWIGNVVVQKQHRGKHIGQQLVQHAIRYLTRQRVKRIALYSFKENVPFYCQLGFVPGLQFARLRLERPPLRRAVESPTPKLIPLPRVLAMDRRAFGADRSRLIKLLLDSRRAWYLTSTTGHSAAYMLVKEYADMNEVGPWVSFGSSSSDLDSMLRQVIYRVNRKPLEVTCPLSKTNTLRVLRRHGFRSINDGQVMFYEKNGKIGQPAAVIAYGFLDKG